LKSLGSSARLGAIVTAAVALFPYITDFFLIAYLARAFAAVWFASRIRHISLSFKEGAQLGFLSGFYGLLAASGIYDFVWQDLHYQLWKIENADRIFALLSEMAGNALRPSLWPLFILQIVLAAVGAGAFGAPAGILAVKLIQKDEASRITN
jgi:hypothetical protein